MGLIKRKHIQVILTQFKNNWVREAIYRNNFLLTLVTDLTWIVVEFMLFKVIYSNVTTIAGWTEPQVYFFLGVFFASDALFTTFFQRNFWNFPDLVNRGDLDILLTKPISAVLLATTQTINLTNMLNIILGFGIMKVYADAAGFAGGVHWLLVCLWLLIGLMAAFLMRFTFSLAVFWSERGHIFSYIYYQLFSLATKPDTLYPAFIRYAVLTVLPFALIGSIPARAVLQGLTLSEYVIVFTTLGFFIVFNSFLWKRGLARYQSASS